MRLGKSQPSRSRSPSPSPHPLPMLMPSSSFSVSTDRIQLPCNNLSVRYPQTALRRRSSGSRLLSIGTGPATCAQIRAMRPSMEGLVRGSCMGWGACVWVWGGRSRYGRRRWTGADADLGGPPHGGCRRLVGGRPACSTCLVMTVVDLSCPALCRDLTVYFSVSLLLSYPTVSLLAALIPHTRILLYLYARVVSLLCFLVHPATSKTLWRTVLFLYAVL